MAPPRLGTLKLRRDAGGGVRISAAPDRSPLVVRAATALSQLTRTAGAAGAEPVEVQPVVQVRGRAGYRRWRSEREAIWRRQKAPYTSSGWPPELPADLLAAVLLPLPYGTTAATARVVDGAGPLFSTRSRDDGSGPEDIAVGLIVEWLRQATTAGSQLRVAPPILETGDASRVLDLGLSWPLA